MTGFRASPMRRICASPSCTKLLPKRSDAKTCSPRCRQAERRRHEARAKAEALFKTREQIARNTAEQAWLLDLYQFYALQKNLVAAECSHHHIRFMGTQGGMLGVQGVYENELPFPSPVPWGRTGAPWKELTHDPSNPETGDPEVVAAVVEALSREHFSGSFIRQTHEKECQSLLKSGLRTSGTVKRISLFTYDLAWRGVMIDGEGIPPSTVPYLIPFGGLGWDFEFDYADYARPSESYGDGGTAELIAGGGYEVFRINKGHSIPE